MKKLTNSQKIDSLEFEYTVSLNCSVGQKFYIAHISCEMELGKSYPEYVELTEWFKSLNGQQYSIEEVCQVVHDKLVEEFAPGYVQVKVRGESPLHMPVTCEKYSYF